MTYPQPPVKTCVMSPWDLEDPTGLPFSNKIYTMQYLDVGHWNMKKLGFLGKIGNEEGKKGHIYKAENNRIWYIYKAENLCLYTKASFR